MAVKLALSVLTAQSRIRSRMRRNLVVRFFWHALQFCCRATAAWKAALFRWRGIPASILPLSAILFTMVSESHNYTSTLDAGPNCGITVEDLVEGATYFFAISSYNNKGWESIDSEQIRVTVSYPPVIITEPSAQTAQAGTSVAMYVDAIGTPPLLFQWFDGVIPISGATNAVLHPASTIRCRRGQLCCDSK